MIKMHLYPTGRKIVIFGTSPIAQRAYYFWYKRYEILGFIDNNEGGGELLNRPIFKLSELHELIYEREALIVIADDRYIGLVKFFKKKGYRFVEHYIIDHLFEYSAIDIDILFKLKLSDAEVESYIVRAKKNKKGFCIFGNCQTGVIKQYLVANKRFQQKMVLIAIPEIHRFRTDNVGIVESKILYKYIDILAIMNIKKENRINPKFATEAFRERVREDCLVFTIPNLWFTAYFPQMTKNNEINVLDNVFPNGFSKYGDKILEKYLSAGMNSKAILTKVMECRNITREEFSLCVKEAFLNLHKSDCITDIKMEKYIFDNFTKDILFYCPNHPKNYVLKEVANRILIFLNIYKNEEAIHYEKEEILDRLENLKIATIAVYPDVLKYLNMESMLPKMTYNPGYAVIDDTMDFKEYVKLFCLFSDISKLNKKNN